MGSGGRTIVARPGAQPLNHPGKGSIMNGNVIACILASALALTAAIPAAAQDKAKGQAAPKQELKVVLENDNVRVTETRWVTGATSDSAKRAMRVVRALKGGTLERTYPDGKKELSTYKTGEVKFFEADGPYALKNVGKTEIVLYSVALKK
jgi:uncharacterized membrane protein